MKNPSFEPLVGRPKNSLPLYEQRVTLLEGEVQKLHGRLGRAYQRIAELEGHDPQLALDQLIEDLKKSEAERLRQEKASLEAEAKEESKKKKKEKPPQRGHGPRPQSALPVVEVIYELPKDEATCPVCGGAPEPMGEQFEESEEIRVIERQYVKRVNRRRKLRCRCNACVLTAPGPPRVLPGGRYSLDFILQVAADKWLDHGVPRRHARPPKGSRSKPCYMEDEGWPLGIGVQAQVPNRLELRGSRARVVSVEGKGVARLRQVRSRKTSASEPLITCREVSTRRRNRAVWLARDEPRESLLIDWAASGMEAA